jgi:hypothetical protein
MIVMLMLTLPVQAAYRQIGVSPSLSFHDTTATCSVFIRANKANDDISADISLWQGNSCIESWEASGSGTLNFESTATVSKGKSYTLKIDFSINGKIQPSVSHSNTCS